ncbi:ribonuclease H-like domain-containing protein [Lactarius quietus]|nr:ribonuclease H-like domain-containing protein [Lactarius quietus]
MHSVLNTFFQAPVSGEEKKRRIQERISTERTQNKGPVQYLLTLEQMVENDYPVPSYLADTPQVAADAEGPREVYAIDCEMCMTMDGKALTRVCVIDFSKGNVVYDQLVKPPSAITDYLTRFSGITAAALDPVTTTLADVQAHLCTLIKPSAILLGHSLESDLRALKLSHPHCIDTALIYHHPRGRPLKPGLAWLTRKWLGRIIQDRGPGGHNPEEDARACIDLLKAKIKNGPGYGEFRADYEPILARIARSQSRKRGSNGAPTRTAIVDHGNPGAWHGTSATAPATTVACANDAEVLDGLVGALDSHEFIFGRLMGLADALGWITPKPDLVVDAEKQNPTGAAETKTENADNALFTAVTNLNAHLTTLHAALPSRTALLLFSGHSDPRSMSALAARRAEYQASQNQRQGDQSGSGAATGTDSGGGEARWSTADDRALEEAVVRARMGLLFVGVKT